jgi:hypothetical protein
MREIVDLRIEEKDARRHLKPEDGKVLGPVGDVRKLVLDTSDIRYARVVRLERELRKKGSSLVLGWSIRRKYTKKELEAAELFQLRIRSAFEPDGALCGTEYDDAAGCPHCGFGARQLNELRLDPGTIPKGKDFARTIAFSELIVSARVVEAFHAHGMTGARFHPVLRRGGRGAVDSWYQLEVTSRPLGVAPRTRFGINLFDEDEAGEYRCPLGHVLGLNLLSELSVVGEDWDGSDVCATRQWTGMRSRNGGAFRPHPLLLISPRLRTLLSELKAKGFELEVAHRERTPLP